MGKVWLPEDSDFALAMREPNLLVPNYKGRNVSASTVAKSKFQHLWNFCQSIYEPDLINGAQFTQAYTEAATEPDGSNGITARVSGSSTLTALPQPQFGLSGATRATLVIRFRPNAINNNNVLFCTGSSDFTDGITIWSDNLGSYSSAVNCISVNVNGSSRLETASNTLAAGKWSTVVISFDGSAGRLNVCIDGKSDTTMDSGSVPSTLGTAMDRFEFNSVILLSAGNHNIGFFATSNNYAATDAECVAWSSDVYKYLTRSANQSPFLISVPAGGESPLAATDPAAQSDADTAAISQTHGNLAASDAEGAADADTAAATQDHALAGTDIEAGADADTGAVDQAGTVAADEAEALADADTAAASQDHQLAGDDIEAQAAPDTSAVDQAGTLAADDAEAQADADTAAASQDHDLAGADIEAQADPDTGAAQQAGVLTADPAEATAEADTAAASQDHDLAGADIEAAADADTGAVDGSATTAADDIEARADADTGAVTVIHKPAAADAEGQAAMDAAAAGQVHQLGADDAEARGDIPAGGLLLDGIGVVFSPQLLDVTLRTYLIDPHNPTGAPR